MPQRMPYSTQEKLGTSGGATWAPWGAGRMPRGIDPMARVVRVGERAWALAWLRENSPVDTSDGLRIEWREGQNSALDRAVIARSKDIGNVRVTRGGADVAYSVDFAFAYRAFYPEGELVK